MKRIKKQEHSNYLFVSFCELSRIKEIRDDCFELLGEGKWKDYTYIFICWKGTENGLTVSVLLTMEICIGYINWYIERHTFVCERGHKSFGKTVFTFYLLQLTKLKHSILTPYQFVSYPTKRGNNITLYISTHNKTDNIRMARVHV